MFLLDVPIGDPTRIPLEDVKLYWKAWVSLEAKGYPFSFLSGEEEEEQEQEQEQEQEEEQEEEEETHSKVKKPPTKQLTPPQDFDCDDGIPLPYQCDTSASRTICLLRLVSESGNSGKTFHTLVRQVDALEVSFVSIIQFSSYLILF